MSEPVDASDSLAKAVRANRASSAPLESNVPAQLANIKVNREQRRHAVEASRKIYCRRTDPAGYVERVIALMFISTMVGALVALTLHHLGFIVALILGHTNDIEVYYFMGGLFVLFGGGLAGLALSPIYMLVTWRLAGRPTFNRVWLCSVIGSLIGLVPLLRHWTEEFAFAAFVVCSASGWLIGLFLARRTVPRIWPRLPEFTKCAKCEYDRVGLGALPCPECGLTVPKPRSCRCCGLHLPTLNQDVTAWNKLPQKCPACYTLFAWSLECQCCGHTLSTDDILCAGCGQVINWVEDPNAALAPPNASSPV